MLISELIDENQTLEKQYDQLTEEEQNALLDHISSQVANDPAAFERLATLFLTKATQNDFNTIRVQPQPGFVCKTHVLSSKTKKYPINTSVYINICHASAIPAPAKTSEHEIQRALHAEPNSNYKVPLSVGQERMEQDCLIMDACIHTQPYLRCENDLDYRLYILELAMEYVEEKVSVHLSREFTMPNISAKGTIPSRMLRLPKPSLMTAVKKEIQPIELPWHPQPQITINKIKELVNIRIPMPDKHSTAWTIDITTDKVILTVQNIPTNITLPGSIDIHDTKHTRVDFYQKSKDLIITLKLVTRTQYL